MINPEELIRPLVRKLIPYSSARDDFSGQARVFLDANESPYSRGGLDSINRYPDSKQRKLREAISTYRNVSADEVFVGNGSDEPIDLLIRIFCNPGTDSIIVTPPTYGMYAVAASIQDVKVIRVPLRSDFSLDLEGLKTSFSSQAKILFFCSPNNPTGACLPRTQIEQILESFPGIVVVDEAYIDYCADKSFLPYLKRYPNLVILQTLSKAWGLAGIRLGMAFADKAIIGALFKVKPPYNINLLTQELALRALSERDYLVSNVETTISERIKLTSRLRALPFVVEVYPSDANFLLVKMNDARQVFESLKSAGIIVRDRSKEPLCDNCLRITVGSPSENTELLKVLEDKGRGV